MIIKVNNKIIFSENSRPMIIAEISGNHCKKKSLFLSHIKKDAASGADLIKIQTYEPEDMTIKSKNKNFKIKSGI